MTHILQLAESADSAAKAWGEPSRQTVVGPLWDDVGGHHVLAPRDHPRLVIFGPAQPLQGIIEQAGEPILWPRQLEQLRQASDADHHVVVLGAPHFLFADGHVIWQGPLGPLRSSVENLVGRAVPAAMLSMHLEPYVFGELRLVGPAQRDAFHLASDLAQTVQQLPGNASRFLAPRLDPYWQQLALAFPAMLTFLQQQSRVAIEGDQAVLDFVLPPPAAHNLVLATELALATPPSGQVQPQTVPAGPENLEQWLDTTVSLEFPQLSLEAALDELRVVAKQRFASSASPFRIQIVGKDLKVAGITRNQQIRNLQLHDRSIRQVLTELVRQANPVAGAALDSPEQKLVWVVATPPGSSERAIVITTRVAAAARSWQLPSPFRSP